MAWMIVLQEVNWARPKSMLSFNAKPKDVPQEWPRDFVDYAVSIGRAKKCANPDRAAARRAKEAKQPGSGD
ncbi:MAG: hypothetical protein H2043_06430 [Rhizobiales bacterium]|nr:hypothetical protein [Hyphomicrobiales bacterium]